MFKEFLTKKGITDEAYKGLEVSKQAELHAEYLGSIETQLKDTATKAELNTITEKLGKVVTKEDLTKIVEDVEGLALKVAGVTEKSGKGEGQTLKSVLRKQVETNKGKEKKDQSIEVAFKADILFNIAATAAGGNWPSDEANVDANILMATAIDLGFAQRLSREATILNKIQGATPLRIGEALKVVVPYDQSGDPIRVTEAKAKTRVAFKLKTEKKEAEKLPIVFYISEEFMNRVDYLMTEIQNYLLLLLTEVLEEVVFDATSGVLFYAETFTAPASLEEVYADANRYDALSAVAATMKDAKFNPDTLVVNGIDMALMFGTKATDGHYALSNGGSIQLIGGGRQLVVGSTILDLIEVNSEILAAGTFAMCDWSKLKFGLGDFITKSNPYTFMRDNVTEFVIEAPFAVMLPSIYEGAVISDTFANVITAIGVPTEEEGE